MGQYLSPGVYVEEVPPLARPIAGVGTSTPGFIGVIPDNIKLPARPLAGETKPFRWVQYTLQAEADKPYRITSWNEYVKLFGDFIGGNSAPSKRVVVEGAGTAAKTYVTGVTDPGLLVTATVGSTPVSKAADKNGIYKIEIATGTAESGVTVTTTIADPATGVHTVDDGQRRLAHAVYGFFNNGGSSCYVLRIISANNLQTGLTKFEAVDEITMVAAPGLATATAYNALTDHCQSLKDRVAILDSVEVTDVSTLSRKETAERPKSSSYAAFYFPWLQVFDPATSLIQTIDKGDGLIYVPPSGHIAGVYARSDDTRGVFKAPANEALNGVTGLKYVLSKADQDGLNSVGVNVIRPLIGAFRVWGARTVGGDDNGEYRYISTRRYFNYLRESIDQGTQFVVFEPNSPALWERIKRTVEGFLLREWRSGALFGTTPDKAFFVKCDADTNPPEVREAGQVVTEIGVAIVKPAEFVIFRIQQMAGK